MPLLNPGTYLILFTADGFPLLVTKAHAVAFGTSFSFFFFPAVKFFMRLLIAEQTFKKTEFLYSRPPYLLSI